jgi:hypothetical protein
VAHPHGARLRNVLEERVRTFETESRPPVFAFVRGLDTPPEVGNEKLLAITDREDRKVQIEELSVEGFGDGLGDIPRSPRQNDRGWRIVPNPFGLDPGGYDLAVDVEFADPARDELRVLRPVVDDQDPRSRVTPISRASSWAAPR